MMSLQASSFTTLSQTTIKPVLALYAKTLSLPIPFPYNLITIASEKLTTPLTGLKHYETIIGGAKTHVTTPVDHDDNSCILYIHGGALLTCSPKSHKRLIAHISKLTNMTAYAPSYPMAYEKPVPEIVQHLIPVYKELLNTYNNVIIAGDSAGGYLTLALIAAARRDGITDPTAAVLISPLADIDTRRTLSMYHGNDPMFPRAALRSMAKVARKAGTRKEDLGLDWEALVSKPMPPVFLNYAGGEMLNIDAKRIQENLDNITVYSHKYMTLHVYPMLCDVVPESRNAVILISNFIKENAHRVKTKLKLSLSQ